MAKIILVLLIIVGAYLYTPLFSGDKFKFGFAFEKSYYINRFYNFIISGEDRSLIRKAAYEKIITQEGYEDLQEKELKILVDNHLQESGTRYAAGTILVRNAPQPAVRWIALKVDLAWIVPHIGKQLPYCIDIEEYKFPKEITQCIE